MRRPKKLESKKNLNTWYQKKLDYIKRSLNDCSVTIRKIRISGNEIAIVFIDGMVDKDLLQRDVISMIFDSAKVQDNKNEEDILSKIFLSTTNVTEIEDEEQLLMELLQGNTILLIEKLDQGFSLELKGWPKRATQEPETETVVRGAHLGFTEILEENMALVRRIIKSEHLKEKNMF